MRKVYSRNLVLTYLCRYQNDFNIAATTTKISIRHSNLQEGNRIRLLLTNVARDWDQGCKTGCVISPEVCYFSCHIRQLTLLSLACVSHHKRKSFPVVCFKLIKNFVCEYWEYDLFRILKVFLRTMVNSFKTMDICLTLMTVCWTEKVINFFTKKILAFIKSFKISEETNF